MFFGKKCIKRVDFRGGYLHKCKNNTNFALPKRLAATEGECARVLPATDVLNTMKQGVLRAGSGHSWNFTTSTNSQSQNSASKIAACTYTRVRPGACVRYMYIVCSFRLSRVKSETPRMRNRPSSTPRFLCAHDLTIGTTN